MTEISVRALPRTTRYGVLLYLSADNVVSLAILDCMESGAFVMTESFPYTMENLARSTGLGINFKSMNELRRFLDQIPLHATLDVATLSSMGL